MPAKKKVRSVLKTAKDSLALLGALEKETMAKAKEYVSHPDDAVRQGLEKLGVATLKQLRALEARIEALEAKVK